VRKLATGISLVALVALLAACSGDSAPPKPVYPATLNLHGDVTLNGPANVRGNISDCAGAGRYADLARRAPVTVSNQSGVPIAVGRILYSVGTNVYQNQLDQCTFRYAAYNVPRARSYQIVIGRQAPILAQFLDLVRTNGAVGLNLPPTTVPTTTPFLPVPTTKPAR
jgi:hypothetical protein